MTVSDAQQPTILLAGGGTGGHVFPMIAVADALKQEAPELRLVFLGTDRGMETQLVPAAGYELELRAVLPIRGGGVSGAAKGVSRAALSMRRIATAPTCSGGGVASCAVSVSDSRAPGGAMSPESATMRRPGRI